MADRVSVIIPCYKDAATLQRALDSIYAQTCGVHELVVVNDCSPESTAIEAILRGYPRVVYIRNERNLGLAATRNVGLHAATGEIVSFLDADDELHPQKVEFQLRVFRQDIAVACRVRRIAFGADRNEGPRYGIDFSVDEVTDCRAIIWRNRLTGSSIMISRKLLLGFGGYDESLRSCEDFDLWLRLLEAGVPVRDIRLPLYLYRYNESGLSRNYPNISSWELHVLRKYFQRQGREFLRSSDDARIWAYWLIKHMLRYEKCLDSRLRGATHSNIALLSAHPLLVAALTLVDRLRVFRLFKRISS
jgi:glycosyltransferase involved in cell wall biosynthesis